MPDDPEGTFTAFEGMRRLAGGGLLDVALAVKRRQEGKGESILVFDDGSGAVIDLDLRGTETQIAARLAKREDGTPAATVSPDEPDTGLPQKTRGRPRLGVVAREVTLLPRQWEWLASRPGGTSQALRRLVDDARRADDGGRTRTKAAREAAYRFLSALAGDLPGFEEAARALFAGDAEGFAASMAGWPPDVRNHVLKLAKFG